MLKSENVLPFMESQVETLMQAYKTDYYNYDKPALTEKRYGLKLIWFIRETGTELFSEEEILRKSSGDNVDALYWLSLTVKIFKIVLDKESVEDVALGTIKEVDKAYVKELLSNAKTITETKDFERWFEQSKVVTSDGNPKIVYHSSKIAKEPISSFDFTKLGESSGDMLSYLGVHFSSSEAVAHYMSKGKGSITKVYLSIQNPLIIDEDKLVKDMLRYGYDNGFIDKKRMDLDALFKLPYYQPNGDSITNQMQIEFRRTDDKNRIIYHKNLATAFVKKLQQNGYDGIIYKNMIEMALEERYDYIAFNDTQIKSIYKQK